MERPEIPAGLPADIEDRKSRARAWFEALRDTICAGFETIEDDVSGPQSTMPSGRFEQTPWQRENGSASLTMTENLCGPWASPRNWWGDVHANHGPSSSEHCADTT